MKVMILANNDVGLYKFRKELIEELISPGSYIHERKAEPCEVFVSLPNGKFVTDLKAMGCNFIDTPINRRGMNPVEDLKLLGRYRKIVKDVKPDVVFGYTIKPNIYGGIVCAENNIPYITNITGLGTAVENRGVLQLITLILYRIALRKVKTVFFQNEENQQFFSDHRLCIGKHKMLPGSGVNLKYYELVEYPHSETVEFVFIARVMKEKGIDQYLEAAKIIKEKYPYTRFHICGFCEQDYEDKIEQMDKENIIIYHGLVSDMRDIYKKVHCTVHPTFYPEGLSNVLLESAASARPIITTNRSGCREVIEDGKNGYLVKERDTDDLVSKIEKFLSLNWNEQKNMGLLGREKVEKEFDRKIVVKKYLNELNFK
ncbi:MAG: glycosyltransferase family 4 protein [Clostridium sp.]|uniref:glycosyltransferase family 4 protein n=1 Tax=Clostridium sp. TaxID=1506 RepID=UPI0029118749|nr:glycosyltransferase family 4 protein [Clostridium sp.]MDU5741521.1 glycosyltransferase family 4 protein [Clostridium sp.]MDU5785975.1 glycosyltransferase family 4 protein [Clostridium sp.]